MTERLVRIGSEAFSITGQARGRVIVILLLLTAGAAGLAMLRLFPDSCQQDGGLHFLFAKWSWRHPELLVGVWSRPLYTTVYALPALAGYEAARALTVVIGLLISWQTWRLAVEMRIDRAPLAIILVWLQPSFLLFSADNMTEPVFALTYVIALRLHHRGRQSLGAIVASLLVLARPEGFFLCLLWAGWLWRSYPGQWRRRRAILWLGCGALAWWGAALLITGDPLFILHNWPRNWPLTGTVYGTAGPLAYPARLPEIVGPFLLVPFIIGLWRLLRLRQSTLTTSFLLFLILHTALRAWGLMGSAGYPRYLVSISPAIALITLHGWNRIADQFSLSPRWWRIAMAVLILSTSGWFNFIYADGAEWSRDARALREVHRWFVQHQEREKLPVSRLIWNEPYAAILFERDPWENPEWTHDRKRDLALLRNSPAGTLVVWDRLIGPKWFGLEVTDFELAGYQKIYSGAFRLEGYLVNRSWFGYGGPRHQTYYLFYKPAPER
ncbi:MAG: hypothetical protein EBZ36_02005 [Acidobacteria bacterium]|nr:hypothetical protein [Acidobacteriota bacterium]